MCTVLSILQRLIQSWQQFCGVSTITTILHMGTLSLEMRKGWSKITQLVSGRAEIRVPAIQVSYPQSMSHCPSPPVGAGAGLTFSWYLTS